MDKLELIAKTLRSLTYEEMKSISEFISDGVYGLVEGNISTEVADQLDVDFDTISGYLLGWAEEIFPLEEKEAA